MRPYKDLVEEGIINEGKTTSYRYIADFYKKQLEKFEKLGLGKKTENGVKITESLIAITEKRLYQIQPLEKLVNKYKEKR